MLLLQLLLACSPPEDPTLSPFPLDGQLGPPMILDADPAVPGQQVRFTVDGAPPGARVWIVMGQPGRTCPGPASDCLDLDAPLNVIGDDQADAAGYAEVSFHLPAGAPRGQSFSFQAVSQPSSLSKSNVLTRVIGQPCEFGDQLATFQQSGWIVDQDRITHNDTTLFASWFGTMTHFDFDLVPTGVTTALPRAGNHGILYNPKKHVMFNYDEAALVAQVNVLDGTGTTVIAGPASTGANTGGAFSDGAGHLHLVNRTGPGIIEMDTTLTVVGTWGTTGPGFGHDIELSADGRTAYKLSGSTVTLYDFLDPSRPVISSFTVPSVSGTNVYDLSTDDAGNLYVVDRGGGMLRVYDPDAGIELASMSFTPGLEPVVADFYPREHVFYLGFFNGGTGILRKYCGY